MLFCKNEERNKEFVKYKRLPRKCLIWIKPLELSDEENKAWNNLRLSVGNIYPYKASFFYIWMYGQYLWDDCHEYNILIRDPLGLVKNSCNKRSMIVRSGRVTIDKNGYMVLDPYELSNGKHPDDSEQAATLKNAIKTIVILQDLQQSYDLVARKIQGKIKTGGV